MKTIITIAIVLLSLSSRAQRFTVDKDTTKIKWYQYDSCGFVKWKPAKEIISEWMEYEDGKRIYLRFWVDRKLFDRKRFICSAKLNMFD